MSKTYRAERKTGEPKHQTKGKMRTCEMCDAQSPVDEMYPIHDANGVQIGVVCEICSSDMELIEEVDDGTGSPARYDL